MFAGGEVGVVADPEADAALAAAGADRITFDPEGINLYENDWRISPQGRREAA